MATTTTNHPLINPSPRKRELTRIDHNTPRYTTNAMISSAMAINGEATWVKSKAGCHINALALRLGRSCLARSHGAPFCFGPAVAAWFNYTCALRSARPRSQSILHRKADNTLQSHHRMLRVHPLASAGLCDNHLPFTAASLLPPPRAACFSPRTSAHSTTTRARLTAQDNGRCMNLQSRDNLRPVRHIASTAILTRWCDRSSRCVSASPPQTPRPTSRPPCPSLCQRSARVP